MKKIYINQRGITLIALAIIIIILIILAAITIRGRIIFNKFNS